MLYKKFTKSSIFEKKKIVKQFISNVIFIFAHSNTTHVHTQIGSRTIFSVKGHFDEISFKRTDILTNGYFSEQKYIFII